MTIRDLEILPLPPERKKDEHGWCFGLPPGIAPIEWPLDPVTGWPLKHAFTLLLPEDHRIHGADLVALSFFATSPEHVAETMPSDPALVAAVLGESSRVPGDPKLEPFWLAGRRAHPRLTRLRDDRGYAHAVVMLTRSEFDGPLCLPPELGANPYLAHQPRPRWLDLGSLADAWDTAPTDAPAGGSPLRRLLPERPSSRAEAALALRRRSVTARAPRPDRIGDDTRSLGAMATIGPHVVRFAEWFGGLDFGGARAALDFAAMRLERSDFA